MDYETFDKKMNKLIEEAFEDNTPSSIMIKSLYLTHRALVLQNAVGLD
jgi:hypothetical protein